jgi:hypothetical protein
MNLEYDDPPIYQRPAREGSWGLIIVTMLCVAYGVWSWRQIQDLKELRIEVRQLHSDLDNHRFELSKLQVRIQDEPESQPSE